MDLKLKVIFAFFLVTFAVIAGVTSLPERCLLPKSSGSGGRFCNAKLTVFYFNHKLYKCQKFVYSGCGGNENRYSSKEECEAACPLTIEEKAKQDDNNKIHKTSQLDNPLLQTSAAQRIDAGAFELAEANQTATTLQPPASDEGKEKKEVKKRRRRTRKLKGKSGRKKNHGRSRRSHPQKRNRAKSRRGRPRGKNARGKSRRRKGRGKSRGRRGKRGRGGRRRGRTGSDDEKKLEEDANAKEAAAAKKARQGDAPKDGATVAPNAAEAPAAAAPKSAAAADAATTAAPKN